MIRSICLGLLRYGFKLVFYDVPTTKLQKARAKLFITIEPSRPYSQIPNKRGGANKRALGLSCKNKLTWCP